MIDLASLSDDQREILSGLIAHAIDANHGRPTFAIARAVVDEIRSDDAIRVLTPSAVVDVFSRDECTWRYCPNPEDCQQVCAHPHPAASGSKERGDG